MLTPRDYVGTARTDISPATEVAVSLLHIYGLLTGYVTIEDFLTSVIFRHRRYCHITQASLKLIAHTAAYYLLRRISSNLAF